jgi:hypothetical protein
VSSALQIVRTGFLYSLQIFLAGIPSGLRIFLAGALMPFCYMAAALFRRAGFEKRW